MHTLTFVILLISQTLDNSCSGTRLPLEVYELTPAAAAAASATETAAATHHLQQHATAAAATATTTAADLKHKTLEYTTFDAKELAKNEAAAALSSGSSSTNKPPSLTTNADDLTVVSISAEQSEDTAKDLLQNGMNVGQEQRRARQMQMHRYEGHDVILPMHLQKQQQQQQQQHLLHESETSSIRKRPAHSKDVRILYQVGDSEDDLPICAPNAVCSKIDLYETPWIERQCRCPESNRMPNVIIHHHNHHHQALGVGSAQDNSNNNNNDKYRAYFEKEKLLQHKRLLMGDYSADKKYESLHLKKLMQKLGAVYEDDLQLQPSDYLEQDYNDALPPPVSSIEQDFSEFSDNEFPHGPPRHMAGSAHMRHSGHRGVREPISFIGGCPSSLGIEDGHTIADKTRHYKLCQPVHKLPVCKHFRDYTWSLTTSADLNVTEQIVHCRCPKNSVTYLTKREPAGTNGYTYLFACSPLTRIRCQRKQPCKLFTVRKRQEFLDEVNINSLCQCPKGHHCPSHHTQSSVIAGESFLEDNIQTYSGYCMAND